MQCILFMCMLFHTRVLLGHLSVHLAQVVETATVVASNATQVWPTRTSLAYDSSIVLHRQGQLLADTAEIPAVDAASPAVPSHGNKESSWWSVHDEHDGKGVQVSQCTQIWVL